ncbi:MAG TPA: OsmC family protein [Gemmatimonadaceae bacterium]
MSTTVKATLEHVDDITSKATVRTHSILVDRGPAKGGNDRGPAGGEYLLVALGGCFTSHLLAAIRAREAPMTNVRVAVTGTMDGAPERFTAFTLDVTGDCGDADLARKLVTIAGRGCQVVNTLRLAGPVAVSYAGAPIELAEEVVAASTG